MNLSKLAVLYITMIWAIAFQPGCHRSLKVDQSPLSDTESVMIRNISRDEAGNIDISGNISGIDSDRSKVMVVQISDSGRIIKPPTIVSCTTEQDRREWHCTINDSRQLSHIAVGLLPADYPISQIREVTNLPGELASLTMAYTEIMIDGEEFFRVISFGGYLWRVKECDERCGPGPNLFSSRTENVSLDGAGNLHMRIRQAGAFWTSSEVVLQENLGYGEYQFHIAPIEYLDINAVLGLFTWDDDRAQNHREIDVELSQWGEAGNKNAQFVVQPYRTAENMYRFDTDLSQPVIYTFIWQPDSIICFTTTAEGNLTNRWNYTGPDIPEPGKENARINLWMYRGEAPMQETEVIISNFVYRPLKAN